MDGVSCQFPFPHVKGVILKHQQQWLLQHHTWLQVGVGGVCVGVGVGGCGWVSRWVGLSQRHQHEKSNDKIDAAAGTRCQLCGTAVSQWPTWQRPGGQCTPLEQSVMAAQTSSGRVLAPWHDAAFPGV
jgi:hypothetical protein